MDAIVRPIMEDLEQQAAAMDDVEARSRIHSSMLSFELPSGAHVENSGNRHVLFMDERVMLLR